MQEEKQPEQCQRRAIGTDALLDSGPLSQTLGRQRRRWIPPILFVIAVVAASWVAVGVIERLFQTTVEKKLMANVAATANAVAMWSEQQTLHARIVAADDQVERLVVRMTQGAPAKDGWKQMEAALMQRLQVATEPFGFSTFTVIDGADQVLTSTDASPTRIVEVMSDQLSPVFCGETVVAQASITSPETRVGLAGEVANGSSLLVAVPVEDRRGNVLATLCCTISRDERFERILAISKFGESGKNYAVDRLGRALGMETAMQPTELVAQLLENKASGVVVNAHGFTAGDEHRVGAAQWLPHYGMGIVSTIGYDEAYASHNLFKRINGCVTGLALLGALWGLVHTWCLAREQRRAMDAERKLKRLGQYALEEKIGEGGMGEVYLGTHGMLRRSTAVKLLRAEKSSPQAIERFAREVRLTSQLTHPNTIAIYDYGRTSEGVFYYAMEHLDGNDLKQIVECEGPQPDARVVHILWQVCGSLREAHDAGLVHRDIKPANVMLCSRGGQQDVAKVLDFGLAYDAKQLRRLSEHGVSGTPAFMAPEAITSPARVNHVSDIYSLGSLAYFLLTGTFTFSGRSAAEIWEQQLAVAPMPPSVRIDRGVHPSLESLVLRCLEIDPSRRPQSIEEVEGVLAGVTLTWSQSQAAARWERFATKSITLPTQKSQPAETVEFAI